MKDMEEEKARMEQRIKDQEVELSRRGEIEVQTQEFEQQEAMWKAKREAELEEIKRRKLSAENREREKNS